MCLGGKSKGAPPVPAPTPPTQFGYVSADTSNSQQRQAAIKSTTDPANAASQSFGAELGSSAPTAPTTQPTGGL